MSNLYYRMGFLAEKNKQVFLREISECKYYKNIKCLNTKMIKIMLFDIVAIYLHQMLVCKFTAQRTQPAAAGAEKASLELC